MICVYRPLHQFPLGVTMSMRRRAELLTFARNNGAVVIEDDYDGRVPLWSDSHAMRVANIGPVRFRILRRDILQEHLSGYSARLHRVAALGTPRIDDGEAVRRLAFAGTRAGRPGQLHQRGAHGQGMSARCGRSIRSGASWW